MRKSLFFVTLCLYFNLGYGQRIDKTTAELVASNFYLVQTKLSEKGSLKTNKLVLKDIAYCNNYLKDGRKQVFYYIFEDQDSPGYVLVSGDERVQPIIGFSTTNSYNKKSFPEAVIFLLNRLQKQYECITNSSSSLKSNDEYSWGYLKKNDLENRRLKTLKLKSSDEFLLKDIYWDQDFPYNLRLSPEFDSESIPMGCVAVAVGQIMKYYNYPFHGIGSKTYNEKNDPSLFKPECRMESLGVLSSNFEESYYNWPNIPKNKISYVDEISGDDNSIEKFNNTYRKVSDFLFDIGVATEMDYNKCGSGAELIYLGEKKGALYALQNHFDYPYVDFIKRQVYGQANWDRDIKSQIDKKQPVLYAAKTQVYFGDGHAWILDGYNEFGLFHMNFGWGGHCDDWFALNLIDPNECSEDDLSQQQQALIEFVPNLASPQVDSFEPDGVPNQASLIENSAPQLRSIHKSGETDYIYFELEEKSAVMIQTKGVLGDPKIKLYNDKYKLIAQDDNSGNDKNSLVALDLNIGKYYVLVQSSDILKTIPSYILEFGATSLTSSTNEPILTNYGVSPISGDITTDFEFEVNYYDSNGDVPKQNSAEVQIDGIGSFTMSLSEGSASDGKYIYKTKLSEGTYSFKFMFLNTADEHVETEFINNLVARKNPGTWDEVTSSAPWSKRNYHTSEVFDNKIWVMGGAKEFWIADLDENHEDVTLNDIWNSVDGLNWNLVTSSAQWKSRYKHISFIFDDKIWVMGGINLEVYREGGNWYRMIHDFRDLWCSEDGNNWTKVVEKLPFWPDDSKPIVFKNKIYIMGRGKNEIWSSEDGVNWNLLSNLPFDRSLFGLNVFDNKIWLFGGQDINKNTYNDVWCSLDGINWQLVSTSNNWLARKHHTSIVFDNKMWIVGGDGNSNSFNDIWFSINGVDWYQDDKPGWLARYGHTSVVFDSKMWVLGGGLWVDNLYNGFRNDVWSSPINNMIITDQTNLIINEGASSQLKVKLSAKPIETVNLNLRIEGDDDLYIESGSFLTFTSDNWNAFQSIVIGAKQDDDYSNGLAQLSCSANGFTDYHISINEKDDENPPGKKWTLLTENANWSSRYFHSSTVFDDKLWIMGGYDENGKYKNDVWFTEDGKIWELATENAEWSKRLGQTLITHNDKLWVLGGFGNNDEFKNDVWCSEDGIKWELVTESAEWGKRAFHSSIVFDNKLWVIGGADNADLFDSSNGAAGIFSDVWYSTDGKNWTLANESQSSLYRIGNTIVQYNNKLWSIGGFKITNDKKIPTSDLWSSSNGLEWEQEFIYSFNPVRGCSSSFIYDERLWLLGGSESPYIEKGLKDVWFYENDIGWSLSTDTADWSDRLFNTTIEFKDKIWILGGFGFSDNKSLNDIWFSSKSEIIEITPRNINVSYEEGSLSFDIISNTNWKATSEDTWLTFSSDSGSNCGLLNVSYNKNNTTIERSATIILSSEGIETDTVTVSQSGVPAFTNITPDNRDVSEDASSTTFDITSNTSWSAKSDNTWLTLSSTSGSNDSTLTVEYEKNSSLDDRIATITISATGVESRSATVTQSAASPFILPVDNFSVKVTSETCRNSNNGMISITATKTYNYTLTVTANGLDTTLNFTDNYVELSDLTSGTYNLSITIEEKPNFSQNFDVVITEPEDLNVKSQLNRENNSVTLDMSGGSNYNINLNGIIYTTDESNYTLNLVEGVNYIQITTDSECQGVYEETIHLSNNILVYPNPFDNNLHLTFGKHRSEKIFINIYSNTGKLLMSKTYPAQSDNIVINTESLSKGLYIIHVITKTSQETFKIVKK